MARTSFMVVFAIAVGVGVGVVGAGASGCGPTPFAKCEGAPPLPPISSSITFHHDVAPIIAGRCARCHQEGGLAPFPLATLDDVDNHLAEIGDAVSSRRMPPWMPATCCNKFTQDPSLTADQIATITTWIDAGAPEGDVANEGRSLEPVGALPRVDATLTMPKAYQPDVAHHDDTRCFMLDWPFDQTKFVTGFNVTPGARAEVHHALVVLAPSAMRGSFEQLDKADAAPGWSCPGGLVLGIDDYIGGWSPGWDGETMPKGTGHRVNKGDIVILTVHYTKPHERVDVVADKTSVDVMIEDRVDDELTAVPVLNADWALGGLPIPAGAKDVEFAAEYDPTLTYSPGKPLTIVGANLHMHERGKSGVVGIKRANGKQDCVVQIDNYDHQWQGDYTLAERMTLAPGDKAYVECHFDNSASHQRLVDGLPEKPRDLNWAEDQEMCVGYLTIVKPR